MKRITVNLPNELAEKVRRAAGGSRQVSAYVARALKDYQEREGLDDIRLRPAPAGRQRPPSPIRSGGRPRPSWTRPG
jgi:predicted transcriptional regulator